MAEKDERINDQMLRKAVAAEYSVAENSVKITEWRTSGGSADVDNFVTDMLAVKGQASVNGNVKEISYMAKVNPKGGIRREMVKKVGWINYY